MTNRDYYNLKAVSYGLLSKLSEHPLSAKSYLDRNTESYKPFFEVGSYVDECFWGNPDETHYIVSDSAVPAPKTKALDIAEKAIKIVLSMELPTFADFESIVLTVAREEQYQPKWGEDAIRKALQQTVLYVQYYVLAYCENKGLITTSQRELARTLYQSIVDNPRYRSLVEGKEIYYQRASYFKFADAECKTLPDLILVDYKNETSQVVDIKTYANNFLDNFYRFRYYYQTPFYTYGLTKDPIPGTENFKVLDPLYVTIDTTLHYPVRIFELSDWHSIIVDGTERIKSISQLIDDYKFYVNTGNWSETREAQTSGVELIRLK